MFGRKKVGFGRKQVEAPIAAPVPEARQSHPLDRAAQYIGFVSPPTSPGAPDFIIIEEILQPYICEAGFEAGVAEGLSFSFKGETGEEGLIYFFEKFSSIWPKGEPAPRPRIPAEMIEERISGYSQAVREVMDKIRTPMHQAVKDQQDRIQDQLGEFLGSRA